MPGRHLPPDKTEAVALVKRSVGRIVGVQKLFQKFFDEYSSENGIYSQLPAPLRKELPDMAPGELKWQGFSDGFVVYIPLGEGLVRSPVNSIFGMLMAAGMHCIVGLAAKGPVRIGIDAAWGVEYRPGELYGAALAYSYDLESRIAQWPRAVVGEGLVGYLQHYVNAAGLDLSSQFRKSMAQLCLDLIQPDLDRQQIVHYLGPAFRDASRGTFDRDIVASANKFIESQLSSWRQAGNKKLEHRYHQLANYFSQYGQIDAEAST